MKKLLRLTFLSSLLMTASQAAQFLTIGNGVELFLTGSVGVRVDDNIFLARDAESDLIFDLDPGLALTFGKNAQLKGSLTLVDRFSNYSDNSVLNANLFSGDFASKFDDGKLKLGLTASFREMNQNQFDVRPALGGPVRNFIRRDIFSVGGTSEVEISQKMSVGAEMLFGHENYKRVGFTDSDYLTVPVNAYYRWSPKTDLSVGYRYRDTRVDLGEDSTDHFFNVGARGEFTPKLSGRFAVGLNTRKLQSGSKGNQLGLDASLRYEITPKTSLEVEASNDFGTGPRGQQERNLNCSALATAKIAPEWSVLGGVKWRAINYGSRTDDYYEAQLGTAYIVNANIRIQGLIVHRDYKSDLTAVEFKNNVFSVAANFRY